MPSFCFRLPGRRAPLGHWLSTLFPEIDRATRRAWIEAALIRVDGCIVDRAGFDCPASGQVEIANISSEVVSSASPEHSSGSPAESLSLGGRSSWTGLIDEPPWPSGSVRVELEQDGPSASDSASTSASASMQEIEFRIGERRDGLARIHLDGPGLSAEGICAALANAGMPLVGDLERGGLGVVGGVRLVVGDLADTRWPDEPAWCEGVAASDGAMVAPTLCVSDESARAIRRGHPWILPDDASDPATHFRPGTLLRVLSRRRDLLAWAHAEGDPRLAARIWAVGALESRKIPSVEARVARAVARRQKLFVDADAKRTNAFRLIHSEGDDLPGLVVDRLGSLLRVLVTGRASDQIRERAIGALRAQLPSTPEGEEWNILELIHVRSAASARFDRVRWISGGVEELARSECAWNETGIRVLESSLLFGVDPGWHTPRRVRPGYGLFVDQRENRARLAKSASRGGSWLNLFAHTGAFSVSLLAAGAERVTSVDLSAAYLARLESNLSFNEDRGVDPARHDSVRGEGRRFLENLAAGESFAGIVLDPPTAAAAGHRFWSLQRDLEPLMRQCVERLEAGGVLLVTQNRSGPGLGLDRVLERLAGRAHRSVARLERAPAGPDHPACDDFPEGEPFEGWLLELD